MEKSKIESVNEVIRIKEKTEWFDVKNEYYTIGKDIRHGVYSIVKECIHNKLHMTYAMKMYDKHNSFNIRKKRAIKHEIQILKSLRNPYIVQLLEAIEDPDYFYLVFEFARGLRYDIEQGC